MIARSLVALALLSGLVQASHADETTDRLFDITDGAVAKSLCSGVFVSGRTVDQVLGDDMQLPKALFDYYQQGGAAVNREARSVTARTAGRPGRTAYYFDGLGCIAPVATALQIAPGDLPPLTARPSPGEPWPVGEQPSLGAGLSADQAARLARAIDAGFAENEARGAIGTRAIAIVYKGRLVAERYAPGFSAQTRLLGYSMSKSVIATLAGLRLGDGHLSLEQSGLFDEWKAKGDVRAGLTIRHLLNMTTGLSFTEDYADPFSDAILAVSQSDDAAAYAASRPVLAPPGTVFHYSTGTNFMLSKSVRLSFADTPAYWRYARTALLERIGMNDAVIEPDASGTFMFVWATARDWARFGLLYLHGGAWQGEAVLPPDFVDFVRTATPLSSPDKPYGGQFWLNTGVAAGVKRWPDAPDDAYAALGFEGQHVIIIPSRDLVIVRLGKSRPTDAWDANGFIRDVLAALP